MIIGGKNDHENSDGTSTYWDPESKEIWFAEYGFASIDAVSNRPSFFMMRQFAAFFTQH